MYFYRRQGHHPDSLKTLSGCNWQLQLLRHINMSGYNYEETSDDGLTRTYKVTGVLENGVIRAAYPAYIAFEECEHGGIYTNVLGYNGGFDENDNIIYGTFSANTQLGVDVYVNEGYDVESITIIQKYSDADGEQQTLTYSDLTDGNTQTQRESVVTLKPGQNVFSISTPKKKVYTVTLPKSAAYTIQPVNGSKTTVDYQSSFSFKINANTGYDLSRIIVTANGQKMTPNANGVYTVKNVSEDIDIQVKGFKTREYIVTFKDYNGKVLKTQTVIFGKAATAPAAPKRNCYTFIGWNTSKEYDVCIFSTHLTPWRCLSFR